MSMNVRQAFLHQPEDHELYIAGQSSKLFRNIKTNVQPRSFPKSFYIPANRGV
jgi:hypothetical protein